MKVLFVELLLFVLFTLCGAERVFTSATYGSIKSFKEKQHYVDAKTTETYISGNASLGKHMQDNNGFDDSKTMVSVQVYQNSTSSFYNYYYGLGASIGSYKFKKDYKDFIEKGEKYNFYNFNL